MPKLRFLFVLQSVNSFAMSVVESLSVLSLYMFKTVRLLRSCSIGTNLFRLVGLVELFRVLLAKKPFLVGLVAQLFQPASNWVETVEKAFGSDRCCFHRR